MKLNDKAEVDVCSVWSGPGALRSRHIKMGPCVGGDFEAVHDVY